MYIILGATGHVGSAVADSLLKNKQDVTVITRNTEKASEWQQKGAKAEIVDIRNVKDFTKVLQKGSRLFLLNPPAATDGDAVKEELNTVNALLEALDRSPIEKVVAESTYGAQEGTGIGDLGVLYEMEQGLRKIGKPTCVVRAAYYMSNWDSSLSSVTAEGKLYTFFPADFKLPMIAPGDIGKIAATLLMEPLSEVGIRYLEGPGVYSPRDVAEAFAAILHKPMEVVSIPPDSWVSSMKEIGFSDVTANSFAQMTRIVLEKNYKLPEKPLKGSTTLQSYIESLCKNKEMKQKK